MMRSRWEEGVFSDLSSALTNKQFFRLRLQTTRKTRLEALFLRLTKGLLPVFTIILGLL